MSDIRTSKTHENPDGTKNEVPLDTVIGENVFIHETAAIGKKCTLGNGVIIDAHSIIGDCASIGDETSVGKCVIISPEVIIENNCKILEGANFQRKSHIEDHCVISKFAQIMEWATIKIGTIIPEKMQVGARATVYPNFKGFYHNKLPAASTHGCLVT